MISFQNEMSQRFQPPATLTQRFQAPAGFRDQTLGPRLTLLDSQQGRVSQLSARGIFVHRLSESLLIPTDVQQVVGNLKRKSQAAAELTESFDQIHAGAGNP